MMRFDTHANRVRYGVSIFVTYTPNEAQNMVMLRLSRTRLNDPVFAEGHDALGKSLCGRRQPPLGRELDDDAVFGASVDALSQALHKTPHKALDQSPHKSPHKTFAQDLHKTLKSTGAQPHLPAHSEFFQ